MPASQALVRQVEQALIEPDAARRLEALRTSADFFVDRWLKAPDDQREIMDDLLLAVLAKTDIEARAGAAVRIAAMRRAPPRVLAFLACDAIEVARPILEGGRGVDDALLRRVCESATGAHLKLVAGRENLGESITEVIAERGDARVIELLACNATARFSAAGFAALERQAAESERLTLRLSARKDLPPAMRTKLVALTEARAVQNLRGDLHDDAGAWLQDVWPVILADFEADPGADWARNLATSEAFMAQRFAGRAVPSDQIARWASRNLTEDVLAGLAWSGRVPVCLCGAAHAARGHWPLLLIARGLGYDWNAFKALLQHKLRREPDYTLIKTTFEDYQMISAETARRLVRVAAVRRGATAYLV